MRLNRLQLLCFQVWVAYSLTQLCPGQVKVPLRSNQLLFARRGIHLGRHAVRLHCQPGLHVILDRSKQRCGRFLLMLSDCNLPLRKQHLLVCPYDVKNDLLVNRLGGRGCAFLEQIGTVNLLLRLEGVKSQPLPREPRGEVPNGLREVERVQREIGLRELPLTQSRSKGIHGVVAARNVFRKAKLRQ